MTKKHSNGVARLPKHCNISLCLKNEFYLEVLNQRRKTVRKERGKIHLFHFQSLNKISKTKGDKLRGGLKTED